jgi:ribose transport system substrate-binding protein
MMRNTFGIVALALLIFCLPFGCERQASQATTAPAPEPLPPHAVLAVVKTLDNPFFQEMVDGFRTAADSSKQIELLIRSGKSEGDAAGQRQVLEAVYNERVKGQSAPKLVAVILTPASSADALVQSIKQFRDADIPVIIVDTQVDPAALQRAQTDITTFIASSNVAGARRAGDILRSRLPQGGRVLLINGFDGHETAAARRQGFLESIESSAARYDVLQRTCNWEHGLARSTVDTIIRSGEHIDGIFAANDQMALGAVEALRQRGIDPATIPIVGFDAIEPAKQAVREGKLVATMMQRPDEMGTKAIATVLALLRHETVPSEQLIEVEPYTK